MIAWMLYTVLAASLVAGAALAVDEAARLLRRPRRWGWSAAMAVAAVLPLAFRLLPASAAAEPAPRPIDPGLLAELMANAPVTEVRLGPLASLLAFRAADPFVIAVWLGAALAMLGALTLTYRQLVRVRAAAARVEIGGIPALLTRETGPMVVGVRRPEVVVPGWIETLSEDEQQLIVRHEWEHVRAGDTRLLLASALLVAAMPWNVPLWWMRGRLRQAVELDCDQRVLASGADRRVYGGMLIRTAGRPRPTPLLAPALVELPSLLERRIVAMTSRLPEHRALRLTGAVAIGSLLFVAACELTPRGGPTPTEPTLTDVLEPADPEKSAYVVFRVEEPADSSAAPDITSVLRILDGELKVSKLELEDSLHPLRMKVRMVPDAAPERSDPLSAAELEGSPLILVDGVPVSSVATIDRNRIVEINVIKGPLAVEQHGPAAKEGVVSITTGDPDSRPRVPGVGAARGKGGEIELVAVRGYASTEVAGPGLEPVAVVGTGTAERVKEPLHLEGVVSVGRGVMHRRELEESLDHGFKLISSDPNASPPLILVDGKKVDSAESIGNANIERIEVIKDPATTAQYGPGAENGVILIKLRK